MSLKVKKISSLVCSFLFAVLIYGQEPTGYYNNAQGLSGAELKTALYTIIKGHTPRTYSNLWTDFQSTDKKDNGKVWDMYSDVPGGTPAYEWTFGSDQCGNYNGEGSCYNREHSFPQSWFNKASPMVTDVFHIYPTDGYVNGKRGNYPFGEVTNPSWTSTNGSKLGANSTPGYSGTVFEPIDEYKGDFARTYFYMATRYENVISNWNSAVLDGSKYPVYTAWHLEMLIQWHEQDPISQKEINRNNAVYAIQHNRNPYIDHPEYIAAVWGAQTTAPIIGSIYTDPASPAIDEDVFVYATITDNGTVEHVTLYWGTVSGSLSNTLPMQSNGNEYYTTIPAQGEGTHVYYSIAAEDNDYEISTSSVFTYYVSALEETIQLPFLEDFENGDLGIFSTINVVGVNQEWYRYTYSTTGNSFAKMSGYSNGTFPNEDWLITPLIDFDSYTDESLSFRSSMDFEDETTVFQVLFSSNYNGSGDPNSADWTNLTNQAALSTGDYTWVPSGNIDLTALVGENTIAFKYVCNAESETWQLDDVKVDGTAVQTGIDNEISKDQIIIFPNPTKNWIQFRNTNEIQSQLIIYNFLGQIKYNENLIISPNDKLDIQFLKPGIYILHLKNEDLGIQNFRLIVQ